MEEQQRAEILTVRVLWSMDAPARMISSLGSSWTSNPDGLLTGLLLLLFRAGSRPALSFRFADLFHQLDQRQKERDHNAPYNHGQKHNHYRL